MKIMEEMEAQRSVGFLICHYYNGQEEGKEEERKRARKRNRKKRCEGKDLVQLFPVFWPKGNEASDKRVVHIWGHLSSVMHLEF